MDTLIQIAREWRGKPASALIPFLKKERTPSVEERHPGDHNLGVSLVWITMTGTFSKRAGWLAATVAGFFYPLRELRQIVFEGKSRGGFRAITT